MAYSPRTIQNAIKQLFDDNDNTTTASGLNSGLTTRVSGVYLGHPKHVAAGVARYAYPFVTIYAVDDSEGHAQLGPGAKMSITANFGVVAAVAGASAVGEFNTPGAASDDSDNEMYILTSNIKSLLRGEINLSQTVDYVSNISTIYDADIEGADEDTFVSTALINVAISKLSI